MLYNILFSEPEMDFFLFQEREALKTVVLSEDEDTWR